LEALTSPEKRKALHLDEPYTPLGPGEQSILDTFAALRELQVEGKIRKIGIAGFPLPYLLRLALLIKEQSGRPVDIIQSYAHQTLLNSTLSDGYITAFEKAGVKQVVNAAPLAMGVLTTQGGPDWHPIRDVEGGKYYEATRDAVKLCQDKGTTLEAVASDFGYRPVHQGDGRLVPVAIGCKNLEEVHRALESYGRVAYDKTDSRETQEEVRQLFEKAGAADWSWANPSPNTL
jgi:aryl-alcohol dehydrogenase-like predicted oxidoreductase